MSGATRDRSNVVDGCACGGPALAAQRRRRAARAHRPAWSIAAGLAALCAPKCPLCFAPYLAVLGLGYAQARTLTAWLTPAALLALGLGAWALWRRHAATRDGGAHPGSPWALSVPTGTGPHGKRVPERPLRLAAAPHGSAPASGG